MVDLITTSATQGDANLQEYKEKTTILLADIFRDDPVIRFMLSNLGDTARLSYMHEYFSALGKAAMLNNAKFQECSDWSCVAVWMPPGKKVDNSFTIIQAGLVQSVLRLGIGGLKRMLWDYQGQTEKLKKAELGDGKFWYLFFIATIAEARGQGLASRVVKGWKSVARKDGLPIWLEATTEKSRGVYERCGFKVVREIQLGTGTHAASGATEKGGPGVKAWGMIWRPEYDELKGEKGGAVSAA
ncbi:hypothetical protein DOTSEDRAFT_75330 [Dothistroma septosporum NZE10]|uniref:N-acetyltransferase domain-containing protein n=1 Tax=Dothistroma septosporum (strain NZE10 / CBS 128990) TaxID=675120 RepID=M2XJK6_DOTSN|nr:hypothetical protein DOTSEDRAFT_75330 [Dothistroma septosporum NZE10]